MKQIIISEYQKNGASNAEAFIDSYLELRASGLSHEQIGKTYKWVDINPYYDPEEYPYEEQYISVFLIEDVEHWFNVKAKNIDKEGQWTNKDVLDVFEGKCTKKYGNYIPNFPVVIGDIHTYKNIQYVKVRCLFFMCETYLIKTEDGTVFSIWY